MAVGRGSAVQTTDTGRTGEQGILGTVGPPAGGRDRISSVFFSVIF